MTAPRPTKAASDRETAVLFPAASAGPAGFEAARRAAGADICGRAIAVASYPRSGNKMTRTFLRAYALHVQPEFDVENHDDPARQAFLNAHFEAAVNPRGEVVSSVTTARELTDVSLFGRRLVIAKTHAARWPGECVLDPVFRLYVVRHPLDVLASSLNFLMRRERGGGALDALIASGEIAGHIDDFIARRGVAHYQRPFGSWLDHVTGWTDPDGEAAFWLRYEDIVRNPVAEYGRVFAAMDAPFDRAAAQAALGPANAVTEIELGRGRDYLGAVLTEDQKQRARDAFAPTLERFDYEI